MHNAGLLLAMFLYLSLELAFFSVQNVALLGLYFFFLPIEAWSVLCDSDIWPAPYHSGLAWPIEGSIPILLLLSLPPK